MLSHAYNLLAALSQPALIVCICCAACCCALTAVCLILANRKKKNGEPPADSSEKEQPAAEVEEQPSPQEEVIAEPEKPQPEPVAEEKPAAQTEPVAEVKPEPQAANPPVKTEAKKPVKFAPAETDKPAPEGKVFIRIRYNRSFTARLIQSDDTVKKYYSEVKNELLSYGLKSRVSWKAESFRRGRKLIAKAAVRGKTLNLYLAGNPAKYAGTKYKVDDVSNRASTAATPLRYKIKNDRRSRYVIQLISDAAQENGLAAGEKIYADYAAQYPYEELEPLIAKKLVKVLTLSEKTADSETGIIAVPAEVLEEVSVTEAEQLMLDEKAEEYVQESVRYADKTKKAIINIDTLAKYFKNGEDVTVEEIKKRVPDVSKKTTYVKVLARGKLDKALNVEADDFTAAAVKMIILTGGKVIRTKTRS